MKRQLLKFFFTQGTIEEKVYQRQISKQGLSGAVVDAKSHGHVKFSLEDLKVIASAACFLPLHWCVLSTVHSVLSRVLWEKKKQANHPRGIQTHNHCSAGDKEVYNLFFTHTLQCIKHCILNTFQSSVKKIHRRITYVGFDSTTFALPEQMSSN